MDWFAPQGRKLGQEPLVLETIPYNGKEIKKLKQPNTGTIFYTVGLQTLSTLENCKVVIDEIVRLEAKEKGLINKVKLAIIGSSEDK